MFTLIGEAAAVAPVKRASAPVRANKSGKKATARKAVARKSVARKRVVRRAVPKFKAYEIAGWPQPVSTLLPSSVVPTAPPPQAYMNCSACTSPLISKAYSLIGIRYRLGGTTPQTGFDCSGFTKYVYQTAAQYALPSSAPQQYKFDAGVPVSKSELEPGDLVFFRTRRGWHVGMFVGEDSFIHAPNRRRTVSVSPLNDAYWRRAFIGARRIPLPELVAAGDATGN